MKKVKAKQVYLIKGKFYEVKGKDRSLKIGDIIYDSRKQEILEIESQGDLTDCLFIAPELIGLFVETDV